MTTFEQDIKALNEKINELNIDLENITRMSVPQRIICKLIKLGHKAGLINGGFRLPITKGTLALQVGIEQETLSRAIHKLPHYGVQVTDRNVLFSEPKLMQRLVCGTCAGQDSCRALQTLRTQQPLSQPLYTRPAMPDMPRPA